MKPGKGVQGASRTISVIERTRMELRSPVHNFALLQACYAAADDDTSPKNLPAGALVLLRGGGGLGHNGQAW